MKKEVIFLVLGISFFLFSLSFPSTTALQWQFVPTGAGEVASIAIAPSNPNIVYAGLENNAHAFYKSTDGGITWNRLTGPGDHAKDIAISPTNPEKAYVATSEVVYTTDKSITPTSRSRISPAGPGADAIDIRSSNRNPGPSQTSFSTIEIFSGDDKIMYAAVKEGAEFAQFAEKNKVYRIIPFGEIDNHLLNHCSKIAEFSQELLTEMRKYYSGQIGVGVAAPWRDCGFSFKGYDYLTISAYPHNDVTTSINWARKVADRSGIKILHVGEVGVLNPDDKSEQQNFQTKVMSKEEEVRFYEDFFKKFSGEIDGISVFYNGGMNFMSINGDPAEEVVKEEYGKLKE